MNNDNTSSDFDRNICIYNKNYILWVQLGSCLETAET